MKVSEIGIAYEVRPARTMRAGQRLADSGAIITSASVTANHFVVYGDTHHGAPMVVRADDLFRIAS